MRIIWTSKSLDDLIRLYDFLSATSPKAARDVMHALRQGPRHLRTHPRLGERIPQFPERDVRRLIIGDYELRYEVTPDSIWILRLWHTREDR